VIVSLLHRVGERWYEGSLRIAQEHLASAVVRGFLGSQREVFDYPETAPTLVVTTPAGQLHELGALVVATAAASEGWRATYLGPNLPAEEIAGAAEQDEAVSFRPQNSGVVVVLPVRRAKSSRRPLGSGWLGCSSLVSVLRRQ
jgi:methanogenic corrinoid protein MtbC1